MALSQSARARVDGERRRRDPAATTAGKPFARPVPSETPLPVRRVPMPRPVQTRSPERRGRCSCRCSVQVCCDDGERGGRAQPKVQIAPLVGQMCVPACLSFGCASCFSQIQCCHAQFLSSLTERRCKSVVRDGRWSRWWSRWSGGCGGGMVRLVVQAGAIDGRLRREREYR